MLASYTAEMSLRIRLLGRPELDRDGVAVRLEGRKTWALLAYLLLAARPPIRREIVDRLWSDADDPLAAMRWTLSQVRKALAPDAAVVERQGALAVSGAFSVDARDALDGGWDGERIEDLARGDLLEGFDTFDATEFGSWLSVQRARVGTARLDAIRSGAASLVRTDPLRALELAERALAAEPFDDALHELVVECHLARGDVTRATEYMTAIERRYRHELDAPAPPRLRRALERPDAGIARPLLRLDIEARVLLDTAAARAAAGAWDDARDMTTRAINAAAATGDGALEVRGIVSFLNIRTCQLGGGRAEWDPLLQRAFMLASDIGDRRLVCDVETERGRLAAIEARFGTAEASLRRALALAEELRDDLRVATARRLLGTSESERCDYASAEADLRAAAEHPERRSAALAYLARMLVRADRLEDAADVAERCAARMTGDGIVWGPLAIIQLGEVRLARGDLPGAAERFASALTIASETGDVDWTVLALRGLAQIDLRDGRPERGATTLRQALTITGKRPGCRRWCEALVLADLVECERGTDRAHVERGLHLTRTAPMPDLAARLLPFDLAHTPLHTVAP